MAQVKFVQAKKTTLSVGISAAEASEIVLRNLVDVYGNALAMSDFGDIMFITIDPGGTSEEIISATGFTVNSDGTVTIDTGITRGRAAKSPYTTGGTASAHAAGTTVVVSDNPQLFDSLVSNTGAESIEGVKTFVSSPIVPTPSGNTDVANKAYVDGVVTGGAADANTTTKGLVEAPTQAEVDAKTATGGTGAVLAVTPDTMRATKFNDYVADTGAADAYAIAPSPAITAYAAGQVFVFKATSANTTTSTLNVNGLGVKTIKNMSGANLAAGEIAAGMIVEVAYDGTNFQMTVPSATGVVATAGVLPALSAANLTNLPGHKKAMVAGETINGATTPVAVYFNNSDDEFYACDGNDNTKVEFIGFAISNGTDANPITIQFSGIVGGFTGLTVGAKYYVADNQTLSTTMGTYEVFVGVALSATEIVIEPALGGQGSYIGSQSLASSGETNFAATGTANAAPTAARYCIVVASISGSGGWTHTATLHRKGQTSASVSGYYAADGLSTSFSWSGSSVTASMSTATNNGSSRSASGTVYWFR